MLLWRSSIPDCQIRHGPLHLVFLDPLRRFLDCFFHFLRGRDTGRVETAEGDTDKSLERVSGVVALAIGG